MKNCNNILFIVNYKDFTAKLETDEYIDSQYDYILTITHSQTKELKYLKRYEYEPNIFTAFENAYETIDDNCEWWNNVNCNKKCSISK